VMQGVGQDILFSSSLNFASPPPVINNEWSLSENEFIFYHAVPCSAIYIKETERFICK
jgi:hypothetical protein